jgi:uncharacterized protein (TIGR02231 family)
MLIKFIMSKIFFASVILCCIFSTLFADTEKTLKADIKHVTVFPDRAQLNHETNIELQAGKTLLQLRGLSPYIDPQTIQVKGFGEFMILSVNHQNNYLENLEATPEIKNLREQIENLQLKAEDEKTAITGLKEKGEFLIANRGILVKETTFTIEQLKSVMDLYTNNMDQVNMTILKKTRLIKDYEKQIAALQQQLNDKRGKAGLPSGEITVSVSSEKQVSGKMTFSYVVTNAGWYPSYDIRVDDIKKPVVMFYKANVFQSSGTEWKNVKLSFSNATPWVAGNVPVLNPWFIDFYTPMPVQLRGRVAGAAMNMKRSDAAQAVPEMAADESRMAIKLDEAIQPYVEKRTGETSFTFDIAIPYTIPSDGKIQTVEIQRITAPAEYKYVTVPKISALAYLTGNITDWAKQSLIGGEATLYFENSFVGKSQLNVNQLTDTLILSLGNDNSILVKREKRKDFTSKKTLGANKTETYSFLISVRNNKADKINITVADQIPVSSNSGITIEHIELSGGRLNAQTGEIKWDLEIKPQETKQLILTYSAKYPKDRTVILE